MEIIKNNYTNINIDDYPNKIFDQNQSISHNSVNAHNYDIYKKYCKDGTTVLEIGCGKYSFLKELAINNINYDGLETFEFDKKHKLDPNKVYNLVGSVRNIPTKKKYDLVFSNQSIEHWHEYNDSIPSGLKEINRVLRIGGVFAFNFPLFLHGHKKFVQGDIDWIISKIDKNYWDIKNVSFYYSSKHPNYEGWKLTGFPYFYVNKIHKNVKSSFNASIDLVKIKNYNFKKRSKSQTNEISRIRRNLQYGPLVFLYRLNNFLKKKFDQ